MKDKQGKIMEQIIKWMFKDVDWELKRKLDKLQEYENKVNPLGLWEVKWSKETK
jgi:hypothetical protein